VTVVAFCAASVSASSPGFPGTIQPPSYPSQKSKEDPKPTNQGSASDDEAGESSSDWDDAQIMEEDPLAFVVDNAIHSHSSDGEADNESENENEVDNQSTPVVEKEATPNAVVPPPPPPQTKAQQTSPPKEHVDDKVSDTPLEKISETPVQTSFNSDAEELVSKKEELQQKGEQSSDEADSRTAATKPETPKPPPPPRNGHRDSKNPHGRPSNKKPLQTLEKLQQLLDDTDYLTSSQQQQQHPPFQNPKQNQSQQQQQSSPKPSLRGINSLWTSKDRTKYKKQQRLQKEQIRLKQQQEEQLRNQQQLPFVETEELSDTDDGLGYTLPNLPVYLSDGEEETDEAYYMEQQISNTKSSSSSSSSSRSQQKQTKQQTKEQYLQQQRDLFFAQQQGQPQQPYPNQQQPPPNPYYGAGAYPPPPPMGFYPYGPPPPQYFQYHPSYYPYTRSLPRIETTVPRHPRPPSTADNADPQESLQQPQQEQKQEDSNKQDGERTSEESTQGVVYTQPYYPQTPEQQEQWHLQQLRIIQAQEKYERDLRRKHQNMLLYNNLRRLATSTWKAFQSTRKVSTCMALVAATCYAAVSPRNLSYLEYNQRFYENLQTTALVVLAPLLGYGWLIVDWNQLRLHLGRVVSTASVSMQAENQASNVASGLEETNELNNPNKIDGSMSKALHALIHSFYSSFVFGYLWVFALEIAWTTILRLGVFLAWEPDMFGVQLPWAPKPLPSLQQKGPSAPFLILPWALREYKYKPKRITLLAADILTSCVACPIIEEFAKLRLLQWTMPLSKNYSWVKKTSKHLKKQKMKTIAEPITAATDEKGAGSLDGAVTNINPYIAGMLAVSLGIKWADAIRRVCMYTKIHDEQKSVYAFLRGLFPVQELCGIMTALGLARRDVLGQKMPLWKLLLPATIVHSLANLRGVKPIFKWNSSTPWTEMQLSPDLFPGLFSQSALSAMEDAGVNAPLPPTTKLQWFGRAFPKIMWVIILARAAGYCAKNYFMINRQAVRRATTYAGKHAAFSAELETAQKLKNIKNEYNE